MHANPRKCSSPGHPTTTTTTTTTTALDIGADFADIEAEAKAKIGDIEPAVFGEVPTPTPGLIATLPPFTAPTIPPPPTIAPIVTLPPPEIPAIAPIATVAPPLAAAPITTVPWLQPRGARDFKQILRAMWQSG